ncbi:MAG TPA: YqaE/Pmp3 family membrane protein [Candidatus Sumerlaeota bacterium]|nr:YqaE/Pmp3 family membrane protein [Candidatus Sumerlaeota bacterium]HMZ51580.1 YqaE/Pmp3 family membrane protein [Candidatus Sumerlaeota bacterium]HNM47975.1 YqaE/Pmp3 family membrane protein [Candidatus Sumerlaeota bacterium]
MNKLLLVVIAILLPPLAVGLKDGIGTSFWINILLTLVGFYVLGLLHALYVILSSG